MRMTRAGIGGLALSALALAFCDKNETGTNPADMAVAEPDLSTAADLSATSDLSGGPDLAGPPAAPTEFTVVRVGTGAAALTNDATAAFLERRKIADGSLVGTPLALPTAVAGANRQLTLSGLASVEGELSRSADGKYLVIAGYAANPGIANISTSSAATYNRVIGRIDAAGNINTATASAAYTGASVRGAASTDGTMLWISSENGIGYAPLNSTALPVAVSVANVRSLGIFGTGNATQLYASSSAGTNLGINTVGTGTPNTAGVTVTRLSGFTDTNSPSSVGFVAFDRDGNGAVDQLYVADDRMVTGGGVQRWKLNGATWALEGTISTGAGAGARFVSGFVSGNTATVLVTTAEAVGTNARVLQLTDNGGTTAAVTSKLLATSALNTTYRGIALAPNP